VNTPFSQQASNSNIGTTASAFQQTSASPFSSVNPFQGQQATTEQAQSTSAFGQPQHQVPAFGQPITHVSTFGTPVQQNSSSSNNLNPFQTAQQQIQPISHQVNPQLREAQKTKKWDDPIIDYLRVEIEAFAAPTFTLGSVPTVAPSRDMCWA
jgi:nucleoporin NUP42